MRPARITTLLTLALPVVAGLIGASVAGGCARKKPPAGPPRVEVPPRAWEPPMRERDPIKPMPEPYGDSGSDIPPPPFYDPPLVNQRTPELRAFVEAYEGVGRPRIMVYVSGDAGTGGRDDIPITTIDYETVENILTDWFAAEGRVDLLSPTERQRLSREEATNLRSDRPQRDRAGGADVIVRVRAQQTRQTRQGDVVRLVGEAVNTDDGRSIGRAVVDVPPPLDKPQINRFTRFVARRLMDQMTSTWRAMGAGPGRQQRAAEGAPGGEFREVPDLREAPGAKGGPDAEMREAAPPATRRAAPTTRPSSALDPREPDDRK